MSDNSTLAVKPIVCYPRSAQVGKTYLMTVDLEVEESFEWQYEEEEYPIYCQVESEVFSSKPVGEPVIVLHRFGGSFGAVKFLLKGNSETQSGNIKLGLINAWGVSVKVFTLDEIQLVTAEIDAPTPGGAT